MPNYQIDNIEVCISAFISDLNVVRSEYTAEQFVSNFPRIAEKKLRPSGSFTDDNVIYLYVQNCSPNNYVVLALSGKARELSREEKYIFNFFGTVMSPLIGSGSYDIAKSVESIATQHSFGPLMVSVNMRGGTTNKQKIPIPTPHEVISILHRLTNTRYEGHRCTSGFVLINRHMQQLIQSKTLGDYDIEQLEHPIDLSPSFFKYPASYRYIDGRNTLYLLSRSGSIDAIAKLRNPKKYDLVGRLNNDHLQSFLEHPDIPWVAHVGSNNDVIVSRKNRTEFRFVRSYWRFLDEAVLESELSNYGIRTSVASTICRLIYAISSLRRGTLLLLPKQPDIVPSIAGSIDNSILGTSLYKLFSDRSIEEMANEGQAIGMLTSDGLTTISKEGKVLSTGNIIDVAKYAENPTVGGGRTQAALAASFFGLSIKVSEDGPISVFRNGEKALVIER